MSTWDKPLTFDSSSSTLQTNTFDSGFGSSSSFQPVAFQPVSFDAPPAFSAPPAFDALPAFDAPPAYDAPPSYDAPGASNAYVVPAQQAQWQAPVSFQPPQPSYQPPARATDTAPVPVLLASITAAAAERAPPHQLYAPEAAEAAGDDVASIAAFCDRDSDDSSIVRFEIKCVDGSSHEVSTKGGLNGRQCGRLTLERGESVTRVHMIGRSADRKKSSWLFETSKGQLVLMGGEPDNLQVQRFSAPGKHGVEKLSMKQQLHGGNLVLGPITQAQDKKGDWKHSTLESVEVFTSPDGVCRIAFSHSRGNSNEDISYGAPTGRRETLDLQDVGEQNHEIVASVLALQDKQHLFGVQLITNRGRRSELQLPSEWQSFKTPSVARLRRELDDALQAEKRAVEQEAEELAVKVVEVDEQPGNAVIEAMQNVAANEEEPANDCEVDGSCCSNDASQALSAYCVGGIVIMLFVYGCTATAYSYSTSTTLGIWLGVFLPCGLFCFFVGVGLSDDNKCCGGCVAISSVGCWLGLLIGLLAAYMWLTPWWIMTHLPTLYTDATAAEWLNNNTTPVAGIFHFNPNSSAFVNQQQYGYKLVTGKKSSTYYCVAPVVSSTKQSRVLFWVADTSCCGSSFCTCFTQWSQPGSVTGAYPTVRSYTAMSDNYLEARNMASNKLSSLSNGTATGGQLSALPQVWLTLVDNPEETASGYYKKGMIFSGVMTALWPCVAAVIGLVFVIAAAGNK